MKTLKLEVGKTYLSREGKEVRIVKNNGAGTYRYEGSDGELYAENGKWNCAVPGHPEDLIEEVPATRHTFNIPDGVKKITVEQVGNRIVVEMVPEKEPKPGDIVFEDGRIMIVKIYPNSYHAMFYPKYGKLFINGLYGIPFTSARFRPATPEEAQPLWDALKKAGKRWNPETMEVEDVPEIDRILEWAMENIKDGYYNQEDVAEAIEGYLKQKEAK